MTEKTNQPFTLNLNTLNFPVSDDDHFYHMVQVRSLKTVHEGLELLAKVFSLVAGTHSFDYRKTTREFYVHTDNEAVVEENKGRQILLAGVRVVITDNPAKTSGVTGKGFHDRDDHRVHDRSLQNSPNGKEEWLKQTIDLLSLFAESEFCDSSSNVPDPSEKKPYILYFDNAAFARRFTALDMEIYGIRLEALPMSREISED